MHGRSRTPRRIDVAHPAVQQVQVSESPPPEDSFLWQVWLSCQDIAQEALATPYVQGIANGTLDPQIYGQYTIQDAVYCYHAQEDEEKLWHKALAAGEEDLAAFLQARYEGYVQYNQETFAAWHIKDPEAIAPGTAAQTYIDLERHLTKAPPIYGLVGMLPCDQLWAWLTSQLQDQGKDVQTNLYSFWITENSGWSGTYRLDNFIQGWADRNPGGLDEQKASQVFRACMTCELNFFKSATGATLTPMPPLPDFS